MSLLIFLDLTYNPGKNFKFYSLQGKNVKIFLIFTYNQGKVFLILPITWGAHVYLVSTGSCPPPLPLLLIILAAEKISETISHVQFSSYNRKQVIFIGQMSENSCMVCSAVLDISRAANCLHKLHWYTVLVICYAACSILH